MKIGIWDLTKNIMMETKKFTYRLKVGETIDARILKSWIAESESGVSTNGKTWVYPAGGYYNYGSDATINEFKKIKDVEVFGVDVEGVKLWFQYKGFIEHRVRMVESETGVKLGTILSRDAVNIWIKHNDVYFNGKWQRTNLDCQNERVITDLNYKGGKAVFLISGAADTFFLPCENLKNFLTEIRPNQLKPGEYYKVLLGDGTKIVFEFSGDLKGDNFFIGSDGKYYRGACCTKTESFMKADQKEINQIKMCKTMDDNIFKSFGVGPHDLVMGEYYTALQDHRGLIFEFCGDLAHNNHQLLGGVYCCMPIEISLQTRFVRSTSTQISHLNLKRREREAFELKKCLEIEKINKKALELKNLKGAKGAKELKNTEDINKAINLKTKKAEEALKLKETKIKLAKEKEAELAEYEEKLDKLRREKNKAGNDVSNLKTVFYIISHPDFKKVASECGYALTIHDNTINDINLVAVAWTDDAKPHEEFVRRISETVLKKENVKDFEIKPNGRVSYALTIMDNFHINLNIIPPVVKEEIKPVWTDADVDAAYLMGAINCDAVEAEEGDVFPSLSKVTKELERLKSLGYDRPYQALRAIRYPTEKLTDNTKL